MIYLRDVQFICNIIHKNPLLSTRDNAVKYVAKAKYLRLSDDLETCIFPFLIVKGR